MWCHNVEWGWWGWFSMGLGMLVLWGLLITVVVVVLRRLGTEPAGRTPEQVLAERYARGDIDDEEFRRRREELSALR